MLESFAVFAKKTFSRKKLPGKCLLGTFLIEKYFRGKNVLEKCLI